MPPKPLPAVYRVRFDPKLLAAAAVQSTGSWQTAYSKALSIAAGHPRLIYIAQGRLAVRSPRSHRIYEVSPTSCTCEARGPCWHLALVRLLYRSWRQARPIYRCSYCGGPMAASRTYAGERSYTCLCCEHEAHVQAATELKPWAESPTVARAAL